MTILFAITTAAAVIAAADLWDKSKYYYEAYSETLDRLIYQQTFSKNNADKLAEASVMVHSLTASNITDADLDNLREVLS